MHNRPQKVVERLLVKGNKLLVGDQYFPLQDIKAVKVSARLPTGYWRWVAYSFGILIATGVLTGGIVVGGVLVGIVSQRTTPLWWDWLFWMVFLAGTVASLGVFIYGRRAYPAEMHVELDLGEEKRVVYKTKRRENAYSIANRIRRFLVVDE